MDRRELTDPRGADHCLREERMGEPDELVVDRDHALGPRRLERGDRARIGAPEGGEGRFRRGGREQERPPRRRRQGPDPGSHQSTDRARDREGRSWRHGRALPDERPGDLERVERIAAGGCLDPDERHARERAPEPLLEELVQGRQRHRPDLETLGARRGQRGEQLAGGRWIAAPRAHGQQHADPLVDQPAEAVGQDRRGARVEPLHVIDRDEDTRTRPGQVTDQAGRRDRERPLIVRGRRVLVAQEGHAQRPTLRSRQTGELVVRDVREQVGQTAQGQLALGFGRSCPKDANAEFGRDVDGRLEDRGLADAGGAGEDEAGETIRQRGHQATRGRQQVGAADRLRRDGRFDHRRRHRVIATWVP